MWPDRRILDLFGVELPILQAPMAGSSDAAMAIEVARAGGLGALACAMWSPDQVRAQLGIFRQQSARPVNLNFFTHRTPAADPQREAGWVQRLSGYYRELGLEPPALPAGPARLPFDAAYCELMEELRPQVVSFHFGLPDAALLRRVKNIGAKVIASATTVAEARRLEDGGCDAVIAQGVEAGGHRGMFLDSDIAAQVGTMALLPQVVDAVSVPVIAAGGIADARGVVAALALGAAAVQIGTAYLHCAESTVSAVHRAALAAARDDQTVLTNVYTGRPARGIVNRLIREAGPMSPDAPAFPGAAPAVAPLRAAAEQRGSGDFSPLWAGQAVALRHALGAGELTRTLANDALQLLARLSAAASG
jgi:nitronate monooxygenase